MVAWDEAVQSKLALAPARYALDAAPPVVPDAAGFYPADVPGVSRTL